MHVSHVKLSRITATVFCALLWAGCDRAARPAGHAGPPAVDDTPIGRAFKTRQSDVQVEGDGVVKRILADDTAGRRHQRFILRLASGQTVLISHNIDLAPRVAGLREGDSVRFNGEYEWNEEGGVIHWTHRDPRGRHAAGWLEHNGRTYQ